MHWCPIYIRKKKGAFERRAIMLEWCCGRGKSVHNDHNTNDNDATMMTLSVARGLNTKSHCMIFTPCRKKASYLVFLFADQNLKGTSPTTWLFWLCIPTLRWIHWSTVCETGRWKLRWKDCWRAVVLTGCTRPPPPAAREAPDPPLGPLLLSLRKAPVKLPSESWVVYKDWVLLLKDSCLFLCFCFWFLNVKMSGVQSRIKVYFNLHFVSCLRLRKTKPCNQAVAACKEN